MGMVWCGVCRQEPVWRLVECDALHLKPTGISSRQRKSTSLAGARTMADRKRKPLPPPAVPAAKEEAVPDDQAACSAPRQKAARVRGGGQSRSEVKRALEDADAGEELMETIEVIAKLWRQCVEHNRELVVTVWTTCPARLRAAAATEGPWLGPAHLHLSMASLEALAGEADIDATPWKAAVEDIVIGDEEGAEENICKKILSVKLRPTHEILHEGLKHILEGCLPLGPVPTSSHVRED